MLNSHMPDIKMSIEEKLELSQKENEDLRLALDASSILAFTDARGIITYVNDNFCQISKYNRDELIGQNHRIINSGYHPKEFFSEMWKCISSGQIWKGEIKNKAKDGTHYWVFTTIVPFMTQRGRPFQYVAIRNDITQQKRMKEVAEQYRNTLQHAEKMASVGELAAGIAHELGSPLTAIKCRMELLQRQFVQNDLNPQDLSKAIETTIRLSNRMHSIIRGMQSLSHDGTNDPFQSICIGKIIKDIAAFTSESFSRNGIQFSINEACDRLEVICQEVQISQVLVNLINNARDAVLGLEERWIRIEAVEAGDFIEVAVTDSGTGIPPELFSKIMSPFYTTKPLGKGSGLGLSISKTIIEKNGGTLWLDTYSANTRFVFSLPKSNQMLH